jgi:hypothetical protein
MDLVVTDLDLSGIGHGLALIDSARQFLGQSVPAVLLVDPEPAALDAGLSQDTHLLRKPINLKELTHLVSTLRERANKFLRD